MKNIIIIILILLSISRSFGIIEKNDYNDIGLHEKNGTYNADNYSRKSYFRFYTAFGINKYNEIGCDLNIYLEFPDLHNFYGSLLI